MYITTVARFRRIRRALLKEGPTTIGAMGVVSAWLGSDATLDDLAALAHNAEEAGLVVGVLRGTLYCRCVAD